jgi:tyrosinase
MTVTTSAPAQLVQAPISYRKNAEMLRQPQLDALRAALRVSMSLGDDRGYQYWAGVHGLPLPMQCQHHTPLFLPWHRAYLYFFELSLKDIDRTVSLPWWDWTSLTSQAWGVPSVYAAGASDPLPNPLAGGRINDLARAQGGPNAPSQTSRIEDSPWRLPTAGTISWLLDLGDFLDFQQQLEQVHDFVHVWVGGTMAEIPFAAYDPLFFAHHTMVDRVWRLWQLRHPTAGMPPDLLDQALPPFNITVRQTVNVNWLGYDYASFSSRTPVGG